MRKTLLTMTPVLFLWGTGMKGVYAGKMFTSSVESSIDSVQINSTDSSLSQYVSLAEALSELEKKYRVSVAYRSGLMDGKKVLRPNFSNKGMEESLKLLLKGFKLNFKKNGDAFFIIYARPSEQAFGQLPRFTLAKNASVILAQERVIAGRVVDVDNLPLIGVSVTVKNGPGSVGTDTDGKYQVNLPPGRDTLVFRLLGYVPQEVAVGSRNTVNITLGEDAQSLSEVVVTAFGLEREKRSLGYATQSVGGEQLAEARQANVVNNLSGRVAGVQITGNSMPGSGAHVVIRGSSSVGDNNQPLIVVDGVPIEQTSTRRYGNGLSEINPDNIKEMTVLKGPTAAALYGSRAANGVIMVTTKDGSGTQGVGVELNANTTFERPFIKPDFQNIYGGGSGYRTWYVDGRNGFDADGIRGTDGVDESWGQPMDGSLVPLWYTAPERAPLLPNPNNWEDFWETGVTQNYNIALSGGNDKGSFRLSVGKLDQKSIMYNNDYWRNNFKINANYKFSPKLSATISAEYVKSGSDNRNYTSSSDFIWAHRHTDYTLLRNWRDYYETQRQTFRTGDDYPYANWQHEYFSNPFWLQEEYTNANIKDRLVGNIALNYKFNDDFNLMVRSGTDYWADNRTNVTSVERTKNNQLIRGAYTDNAMISQETNHDAILTFNKDLSSKFSLNVQAGAINRTNYYKQLGVNVTELTIDGLYNLGNNASPVTPSSELRRREVNSLFGSAQLGYNRALYLDVTGRNDWSSTLPIENNSFFYPSVSLSAIVTELLDIQSNALSFAKVRGSLAQVGADTDPYRLAQVFASQGLWAGTTPTYAESSEIANATLQPEITTGWETGLELRFLKNRLGLDFTYYNQSTTDQILAVTISSASGYASQVLNAGKITNKGIELMLTGTPIQLPSGFSWDVSFNFARNRNLVVELAEGLTTYTLGSQNSLTSEARVGEPYGTLYGRRYERSPDGQVVYLNGLPQLEPGTFALGNIQPDWIGGFSNTFNYKGFSLGTLVDVKIGGDMFDVGTGLGRKTGQYIETAGGREEGIIGSGVKNVGTSANPVYVPNDVVVAATTFWNAANPRTYHEAGIFDATTVRLREVTFGYTFPKAFLGNRFIQSMRLSAVGRNLIMFFRNHPHIDPEVDMQGGNAQGFASGQQPTTRNIGFNLNVTF